MKHILVTGGAGFIGANFVKYMLSQKIDVQLIVLDVLTYAGNLQTIEKELPHIIFIKGSITDKVLVREIFEKYNIDVVVNFAAESHVDRSIENPQIFLETNILGTQNLLEHTKKSWQIGLDEKGYPTYQVGKKFVQVSTDEVYGSLSTDYLQGQPLALSPNLSKIVQNRKEIITFGQDFFTENTSLNPCSPYSASKASADMIVEAYGDTYKFPYNITRCSNNYGPYHFPEKLIPLVIKNILEGRDIPVYGKGENVRDWLYVEDHCKAIGLVIDKGRVGEVYNVGGFNEAQNINIVKTIINTISELIEQNPYYKSLITHDRPLNTSLISYVKDRLGHDARYAIDPTKITTELG